MNTYRDTVTHPACGSTFVVCRREESIGKRVQTYCPQCKRKFMAKAGRPKGESKLGQAY